MKTLFRIFFASMVLFLISMPLLFAQEPVTDIPVSFNPADYVATFPIFAGVVLALSAFLIRITKAKGFVKQYLSWVIALAIGFIAYLLNLGIFADATWWQVLLYSLFFGLGANGIYDWQLIQKLRQGAGLK